MRKITVRPGIRDHRRIPFAPDIYRTEFGLQRRQDLLVGTKVQLNIQPVNNRVNAVKITT